MPDEQPVLIPGYGKLLPSQMEKKILSFIEDAVAQIEAGHYGGAHWLLHGSGVVEAFLNVLKETESKEWEQGEVERQREDSV